MSSLGLPRKWLVACVAWITCVALIGYVAVFLEMPREFRYVHQVRSDVESWQEGRSPERAPIYDVMRSPAQEKQTPRFVAIDDSTDVAASEWHEHVDEGPMLAFFFFDGTVLHLGSLLSEEDRKYLTEAFWNERWSRWSLWASVGLPWVLTALVPPALLLGARWLGRRRRAD
jgi:hypothetical protein